jgi:glycosyltransferase involved in cell wall biosynthesis
MIEATSVTGSAKAVLEFGKEAATRPAGLPKVEFSILAFNRGQGENGLTKAVRELDIPIDVVSERRRFDTRIVPQLHAVTASRRPDVIWSNSVKSHFVVRWAGLNHAQSWVAFHHGYTRTDVKMLIYNQLDRWSLPGADQVLTPTSAFVDELERRHVSAHRIHIQPMPVRAFSPVADERCLALCRELSLDPRMRVVLCVARLSREKGHADLLRAFAVMKQTEPELPLRLLLVGEGTERNRIGQLCRELNLTEHVTLAGQQTDVNSYYAIADVFVLPSLSEGCPNVLLEAMAAGVPVVATAVGGVPEIVAHQHNALLVKPHNVTGLAAATLRILKEQALRDQLAANGREIVDRYTPKKYFEALLAVFEQACPHRHASA